MTGALSNTIVRAGGAARRTGAWDKGVMRRVIFSGIQPTGRLHLGNYLGAVRSWVALSKSIAEGDVRGSAGADDALLLSIVDLHALTSPRASSSLAASTRDMAASLLACGLAPDSERVVLFAQSAVREHTELAWLLACNTPLGALSRMTQFKAKKGAARDAASLGLLAYPVLQAADILLYRATHVPVGEDQHQHLELARELAAIASAAFGANAVVPLLSPLFPAPSTLSTENGARVMSLADGTRKMSKSDGNDASRINMDDADDVIVAKVRAARTDSERGFAPLDRERRPEKSNLVGILAALTGETAEGVAARHAASEARFFKEELAEALVATVAPIRTELGRLRGNAGDVDTVLQDGARAARGRAEETMRGVRALAGFS